MSGLPSFSKSVYAAPTKDAMSDTGCTVSGIVLCLVVAALIVWLMVIWTA